MATKTQQLQTNYTVKKDEVDDPSQKELNTFVQNLLKQMQDRFEDMSTNIVSRIDEMGRRIDDIEKSISELMNDVGVEEVEVQQKLK